MKNTKIKMNKNQKGQTLLFVIVAVTIAMAVGVAVSTRTIQSLKRVARTDTSARVIAAAEGGIENLLGRNYSQLDGAVYDGVNSVDCESIGATPGPEAGTCSYVFSSKPTNPEEPAPECTCVCKYCDPTGKCAQVMGISTTNTDENLPEVKASLDVSLDPVSPSPVECIGTVCSTEIICGNSDNISWCTKNGGTVEESCLEKQLSVSDNQNTGDLISSRAVVRVEEFSTNEDAGYSFNLVPGSVKEVNLDGYSSDEIKICWENTQSAIYYLSYNKDGDVLKGGLKPVDDFQFGYISDRFVHEGVSTEGSYLCKTVSLVGDSRYGLRIKVLYNDSKVAVFPSPDDISLPPQGYKFTSRGEIVTGSGSEEKATVIVHKSLPYASDIFDYGIYTPATLQ